VTALEAAKDYMAIMRAWNYFKKEIEHRERYVKKIESAPKKEYSWWKQYLPTAKTSLKRNRRRFRQVSKLKTAIENAMRNVRVKISESDLNALWPPFIDRKGRSLPPWKVQEELIGRGSR
jgi:hypothetical protein